MGEGTGGKRTNIYNRNTIQRCMEVNKEMSGLCGCMVIVKGTFMFPEILTMIKCICVIE